MLSWLVRRARCAGVRELAAVYVRTPKNGPCLEFWRRSGFSSEDGVRFTWKTDVEYPAPATIRFISPIAAALADTPTAGFETHGVLQPLAR